MIQQQLDADGLPPLAPPDASDDERASAIVARMVARYGAPSIEDYRRVYEQSGVAWPGDVGRQIQPLHASSPHLRDLDDRITAFLIRTSTPPH